MSARLLVCEVTIPGKKPQNSAGFGRMRGTQTEAGAVLEHPPAWLHRRYPAMHSKSTPPFDASRYYLGRLCKRDHEWEATGQSLRNSNNRICVACQRENDARRGRERRAVDRSTVVLSADAQTHFWERVQINSAAECWPWCGRTDDDGYGLVKLDGLNWRAHRVAWLLANGSMPTDADVLHDCDNRLCCNARHLRTGTNLDNQADKVAKDRHAKGETVGTAKLTTETVQEIRRRVASGESQKAVAADFGISTSQLNRIVKRQAWAHV